MAEPKTAQRRLRRRLGYHGAWLAPMFGVAALSVWSPPTLMRWQDQVFDLYQRLRPARAQADSPVLVVDIDDRSIARLGQWPWPRNRIADLVERLHAGGAAAIAFDIVFSEPDRTSASAIVAGIGDATRREKVRAALEGVPDPDVVLAKALASANVVLGTILTQNAASTEPPDVPYGLAVAGEDPSGRLVAFRGAVPPLPLLAARAAGIGSLNWLPDADQVVRRVPLVLRGGDRIAPSLALEAIRVAQGASTYVIRGSDAADADTDLTVKVGALTVPSDPQGARRLHFAHHAARRFLSAADVMDGRIDARRLQDRIVLVGSSSPGLADLRATPVDAVIPGVEIQAQAIESILDGRQLTRPSTIWPELLAGAALALALAMLLPSLPVWAGIGCLIAAWAAIGAASWSAFCAQRLLLDPTIPNAMVLSAYFGALAMILREEQHDRRFVEGAFGRFVSPEIVARLARDPARLALGGELRPLTIMFSDIRNFSGIAERMDAEALTRLLNDYLSPMSEIVLERRGTVDKYIGDAIMAFWNAPVTDTEHARHAVETALAMIEALPAINERLRRGSADAPSIRCGIGLATGPCVVGNLGSSRRFDYSAIGDNVNLASRLEGLTKTYGVPLLATETTAEAAPEMAWLAVDDVVVLGRSEATTILTALGDARLAAGATFQALRARHEAMLAAWRHGRFVDALDHIETLLETGPKILHPVYRLYRDRCTERLARPDAGDFVPITRMQTK